MSRVERGAAEDTVVSELTSHRRRDRGFTLVEITVVIVILGIIAAVTIFSVRGVTERGEESTCGADARVLTRAAEVYFAQHSVDELPATGTGPERFEATLVDAGLLADTSSHYDIAADGTVTTSGEPCP